MRSYTLVIIVGRMGQTPELKHGSEGRPYCRLSLATDKWNPKISKNSTHWHTVYVFGSQAEQTVKMVEKGRQVFVEGRLDSVTKQRDGKATKHVWINAYRVSPLDRAKERSNDPETPNYAPIYEPTLPPADASAGAPSLEGEMGELEEGADKLPEEWPEQVSG